MVSNLKEKLDWAACSRLHSGMPSVIDLSSGYTKGGVVALYSFQGLDLTRQGSRKQRKGNSTNFLFCLPRLTAVFQSRTKFCKPQSYYTKRHNQREKIAFRIPNESSCFEQELVTAVNVKASKLLYQQWETCSNIYFMFYLSLPSPLSRVYVCVKATGPQTSSEPRMNLPSWFSSFHLWSFGIIGMSYTHGLCGAEAPGKHSTNWTASLALF